MVHFVGEISSAELKPSVAEELIGLISPLRDAIHANQVRYNNVITKVLTFLI